MLMRKSVALLAALITSGAASASVNYKADLVATIQADSMVVAGKRINARYWIKNKGHKRAVGRIQNAWTLEAFGGVGVQGFRNLGTTTVTINIYPHRNIDLRHSPLIPANTAAGQYNLCVFVDKHHAISELTEANNKACQRITVKAGHVAKPDLMPTIRVNGMVQAGRPADISYWLKNIGHATARGWIKMKWWLKPQGGNNTQAIIQLGQESLDINIAKGRQLDRRYRPNIPAHVKAGTYQICVKADAHNAIMESNENNNVACKTVTVKPAHVAKPDLMPTLSVNGMVQAGKPANISYWLKNIGHATARGWIKMDWWMQAIGGNNAQVIIPLGHHGLDINIAKGRQIDRRYTPTIPAHIAAGTYKICVKADKTNTIMESNENNNVACKTVTVKPAHVAKPDLMPTLTVNGMVQAGKPANISYWLKNIGHATARGWIKMDWWMQAIGGNNAQVIIPLGHHGLDINIAKGRQIDRRYTPTIPAHIAAGTYKICVKADKTNTIMESNENNNVACKTVTVKPAHTGTGVDFMPKLVLHTSTVKAGSTLRLSAWIKNIGRSAYLSSKHGNVHLKWTLVGPQSKTLSEHQWSYGRLNAGRQVDINRTFTIHSSQKPGRYSLCLTVDSKHKVKELNEGNNKACFPLTIMNNGPVWPTKPVKPIGNVPDTLTPETWCKLGYTSYCR